jgi:hypothetical protein
MFFQKLFGGFLGLGLMSIYGRPLIHACLFYSIFGILGNFQMHLQKKEKCKIEMV